MRASPAVGWRGMLLRRHGATADSGLNRRAVYTNLLTLPHVYRAQAPPTIADVRELKAFLESNQVESEKKLQHLLERHPSLIGVLGFTDFLSEAPIIKTNIDNEPQISDLRRRDRADLIAAKPVSPLLTSYFSANIIELKAAACSIREREVGFRFSPEANEAIGQLQEYRSWLTTIPQNKAILKSLGWDVRWPTLTLIMGRTREFEQNPGQLEEIRSRMTRDEVHLLTVDDVLERAMRHVEQRIIPPNVVDWFSAPTQDGMRSKVHLAGAVIDGFQMALELASKDPTSIAMMPYRAFEEFVAEVYRRLGYSVELTAMARDGGVDIMASRETPGVGRILLAIQCKSHKADRPVGIETVRALIGLLSFRREFAQGALVTSGRFSRGAIETARQHGNVALIDLPALVELIRSVL